MEEKHTEVFSLKESSGGRQCTTHTVCGASLQTGDLVYLKHCVLEVDNSVQSSIAVTKVVDGTQQCQPVKMFGP